MPENTDTQTHPVTERIPHDGPWYTRPAAATFSRACAYGEGAYNCDGSTTEPTGDYGPTCECPCHDYWNGRDDLAAWHREHNTDKRFLIEDVNVCANCKGDPNDDWHDSLNCWRGGPRHA